MTTQRTYSRQQRRVIETEGVEHLGTDMKGRPVVAQMTGIPQQLRIWALTKKGEPVDVVGNIQPLRTKRDVS